MLLLEASFFDISVSLNKNYRQGIILQQRRYTITPDFSVNNFKFYRLNSLDEL